MLQQLAQPSCNARTLSSSPISPSISATNTTTTTTTANTPEPLLSLIRSAAAQLSRCSLNPHLRIQLRRRLLLPLMQLARRHANTRSIFFFLLFACCCRCAEPIVRELGGQRKDDELGEGKMWGRQATRNETSVMHPL